MPNQGVWDVAAVFPGAGYYTDVSNLPAASQLCTGTSFFGTTGSTQCGFANQFASGAHREKTATQMAQAQELAIKASVLWGSIASGNPGYGYREVPIIGKDDEGYSPDSSVQLGKLVRNRVVVPRSDGSGVTTSNTVLNAPAGTFTNVAVSDSVGIISSGTGTVTPNFYTVSAKNSDTQITLNLAFVTADAINVQFFVDRPTSTGNWDVGTPRKVCGKDDTTVASKILDCATSNSSAATWNGATRGLSGEGSWTLVTVYSATLPNGTTCDSTCYEVWRDNRTNLLWSDNLGVANWCHASGNHGKTGALGYDDDPNNYCNDEVYQNQTAPISRCAEGADWLDTPATYDPQKGAMRKLTTPAVQWRLPTIQDYRVANNNGMRFVLSNMASSVFWSASVDSSSRSTAWLFYGHSGSVNHGFRNENTYAVRCIGGE
jgi:hypothetical protein